MFYNLSWIDVPWGFGVCNMKSQLLENVNLTFSKAFAFRFLQISCNWCLILLIPQIVHSFVSILTKSHFCLVGKSIGACRARFEFWLHHLTGNKILLLLSLIFFLIFKCGDKNLPYFTEFPEARMIPKVRNCFVNDRVCHKWLSFVYCHSYPLLHWWGLSLALSPTPQQTALPAPVGLLHSVGTITSLEELFSFCTSIESFPPQTAISALNICPLLSLWDETPALSQLPGLS